MADVNKLKELHGKISEQKSKLEEVKKMQATEKNLDKLVELKRTAAGIENVIAALENTYKVASYEPPAPTDMEILLSGVNAYIKKKQEKVKKVQNDIDKALKEQREVEASLHAAVESGNADEVIKLSKQRDSISEKLKYLHQMKEQTAALRTFPEGAIEDEWEKVCAVKQEEWDTLVLRTEVLANEYRKACDELLGMNDFLKNVRTTMRRIGEQNGVGMVAFHSILTAGLDATPLTINKADGIKPLRVTKAAFGNNQPL